jgi:hypothetical protein
LAQNHHLPDFLVKVRPLRAVSPSERATAVCLGILSINLGILAAMIVTPALSLRYSMRGMLLAYGFGATAAAVLSQAVAKENPCTPTGFPE